MQNQKKIIGVLVTIMFLGVSFWFIKNLEDKTDSIVVFRNEYCNVSSVTFSIYNLNGEYLDTNFNNNGKPIKCNEEVSREINPSVDAVLNVSVSGLPTGTKIFQGGFVSPDIGSINVFTLSTEGEIVHFTE